MRSSLAFIPPEPSTNPQLGTLKPNQRMKGLAAALPGKWPKVKGRCPQSRRTDAQMGTRVHSSCMTPVSNLTVTLSPFAETRTASVRAF